MPKSPQPKTLTGRAASAWNLPGVEATHAVAAWIARALPLGSVVGLSGPLGAGKTEFVRGFVGALGPAAQVASPTFVLEAVYQGERDGRRIEICHWDLYRLAQTDQTIELVSGFDLERSITLVEWPERVAAVMDLLSVRIGIGFLEPQKGPEKDGLGSGPLESGSAGDRLATGCTGSNVRPGIFAGDESELSDSPRVISVDFIGDSIGDGDLARRFNAFAASLRLTSCCE